VFPVDSLERLTGNSRGVRAAVEGLLEVACSVSRLYRPEAEIRMGAEAGVWVCGAKLASVGVHIEKGVLLHGFALNVQRTEQSFRGLRPCGMDVQPAFLGADFETVGRQIIQEMQSRFWCLTQSKGQGYTVSNPYVGA
jgi:lipoate-protein ligase B